MNLTTDRFVDGLEESARNVRRLIINWETFDDDLKEHYADEIAWMLNVCNDVRGRASTGQRERIDRARADIESVWSQR